MNQLEEPNQLHSLELGPHEYKINKTKDDDPILLGCEDILGFWTKLPWNYSDHRDDVAKDYEKNSIEQHAW